MPWHVENSPSKCSASKPWAVVKDSDGDVAGCHATKSAAHKQLAALNAAEPQASKGETMSDENTAREAGAGALENGHPPRDNLIRAFQPGVQLVRAADEGEDGEGPPRMVGHFTRFGEWTEINSFWEGNFMERFKLGAFKKTFRENRDKIRALFQHGQDPVVGDKPLGPVDVLREEDDGPWYEVPLLDAPYVRDNVLPGLEAGLYGASFRFRVMKEEFVAKPRRSDHNPDGLPERTVTEAQVMEFGPVTFPAYAGATAGIRSLTDEFMFGRLIDQPDKLRELIEATVQTRSIAEPEPSEAATPPAEPEPPGAATPDPNETRETIRLPAPKKETKTMTVDERRARVEEIKARRQEIHAEYGADKLPDEIDAEWRSLTEERDEHLEAIAAYEERVRQLEEDAKDERRLESEDRQKRTFRSNVDTRKRIPDNVYAVEEYRAFARSLDELPELYRDGAMRALDGAVFPHERAEPDKVRTHVEKLLSTVDDPGKLAQRMLATGSPLYGRAFGKMLVGKPLNAEEQRALAVGGEGGQAVPYTLDPTIIPTSDGSVNPLRAISRVETITGNQWLGVSSAGITAAYTAEATEASDNAPDLSQPQADVEKAQAFIPYSIEIGQDWGSLQTEMARLLQDAKDDLEATKFFHGAGHGSNEPEGLLVGGTAVVTTTAATTFAVADVYKLEEALPPRFVQRARVLAHRKQYNRVRQFDTAGGAALWVRLGDGLPPELVGYPAHEASSMSTALTSGATIMTIGDFSHFLIVDRVGMSIEVVPHLFGGSNNFPTGQRGLYAYWRNTSDVLAWAAFRSLKVT